MISWIKAHLVDNCAVAHRLWTIQLAIFWGAFSGLMLIWPALMSFIPLPVFFSLSILFSVILGVARVTKQPGLE